MELEEINVTKINWKKWLKIGVGLLVSVVVIRTVIFTLFFGAAWRFVSDFNREFFAQQSDVHSKIDEAFRQRDIEVARMNKQTDEFDRNFQEQMERGKIRSGQELAEYVIRTKQDYETRLMECQQEDECAKYLNNEHLRIQKEFEDKLAACQKDAECQKSLNKPL